MTVDDIIGVEEFGPDGAGVWGVVLLVRAPNGTVRLPFFQTDVLGAYARFLQATEAGDGRKP